LVRCYPDIGTLAQQTTSPANNVTTSTQGSTLDSTTAVAADIMTTASAAESSSRLGIPAVFTASQQDTGQLE